VYKWIVLALSISSDFWLCWLVHEAWHGIRAQGLVFKSWFSQFIVKLLSPPFVSTCWLSLLSSHVSEGIEVYKWIVLAISISLDFWLRLLVHEVWQLFLKPQIGLWCSPTSPTSLTPGRLASAGLLFPHQLVFRPTPLLLGHCSCISGCPPPRPTFVPLAYDSSTQSALASDGKDLNSVQYTWKLNRGTRKACCCVTYNFLVVEIVVQLEVAQPTCGSAPLIGSALLRMHKWLAPIATAPHAELLGMLLGRLLDGGSGMES
jgi:hypothetical protein